MNKLKIALLEDSPILLKTLEEDLIDTNLVDVIAVATNSTDFFEKIKTNRPEALLLDIDLAGDSMNGLDVANRLKLPVLFVSGKTMQFHLSIEELNLNSSTPVEQITKPITTEKLKKILPKFINEINAINQRKFIQLELGGIRENKIAISSIVCMETETGRGGESNNKRIFFTDRKSEVLFNFSFSKMEAKGFEKVQFIQIRSSHQVNADKIIRYNKSTYEIDVEVFKSEGKTEVKKLPVSENFRKAIETLIKI